MRAEVSDFGRMLLACWLSRSKPPSGIMIVVITLRRVHWLLEAEPIKPAAVIEGLRDRRISLLGVIMALGIPAIAWVENSALLAVLIVGAV